MMWIVTPRCKERRLGVARVLSDGRRVSVDVRPSKMRRSGRRRRRWSSGTEGRTHGGMRVAETPGGRELTLVASMMVKQLARSEWMLIDRWIMVRARLCRLIYSAARSGWVHAARR